MTTNRVLRIAAMASSVLLLVNCTSGGNTAGGGTTTGPITATEYKTNFDRVTSVPPTSDMPTSLSASYAGATKMEVNDGAGSVGEILADLALDVNWTDGQTTNPFTGTATNFRGTVDGVEGTYAGTLNVDSTLPAAITRNVTTIVAPVIGPVTTETGAMIVALSGDLEVDGQTGTAVLGLGGNFFGPGGDAIVGSATGTFGTTSGFAGYTAGGTFYLEAQ